MFLVEMKECKRQEDTRSSHGMRNELTRRKLLAEEERPRMGKNCVIFPEGGLEWSAERSLSPPPIPNRA